MAPIKTPEQKKERANGVIVASCIAFVVGMTGMAYAARAALRHVLPGGQAITARPNASSRPPTSSSTGRSR